MDFNILKEIYFMNDNGKEKEFEYFINKLKESGKRIEKDYFQINIIDSDSILRERVYCYELYHQLRIALNDKFQKSYKLHGELDKAGHSIIKGAKKPDFLVHLPGCMSSNFIIIEVKTIDNINKDKIGTYKDITTIRNFIKNCGYYRGIMLIYGTSNEKVEDKNSIKKVQKLIDNYYNEILLFYHKIAKTEPILIKPGTDIDRLFD